MLQQVVVVIARFIGLVFLSRRCECRISDFIVIKSFALLIVLKYHLSLACSTFNLND